jgi:hypothetical protein
MNITKEQVQNIILEELESLLKESQLQDEGILDLLKKKKSPTRSADDEAALTALQTMSPSSRSAAIRVKVTGYRDLASKEQGKPVMKKTRSYSLEEEPDDFERFTDTPGYEDERVPGKTAWQRKRADLPPEEPKYDDSHLRDLGYLEEGDEYPSPSKMKKLVAQALRSKKDVGRNPVYDPDKSQLRKDYDKHVRNTLRDPKHSQAHKR